MCGEWHSGTDKGGPRVRMEDCRSQEPEGDGWGTLNIEHSTLNIQLRRGRRGARKWEMGAQSGGTKVEGISLDGTASRRGRPRGGRQSATGRSLRHKSRRRSDAIAFPTPIRPRGCDRELPSRPAKGAPPTRSAPQTLATPCCPPMLPRTQAQRRRSNGCARVSG